MALYDESELSVLAPLIAMDKHEIIDLAQEIGTYDLSALPYDDCCSFFVPKHPELRARGDALRENVQRMDLDTLMTQALGEARIERL